MMSWCEFLIMAAGIVAVGWVMTWLAEEYSALRSMEEGESHGV